MQAIIHIGGRFFAVRIFPAEKRGGRLRGER